MTAPVPISCSLVIVDIEGTTSAASHVLQVLFPYSRARMADWIAAHHDDADVVPILAAVAQEAGCSPDDLAAVTAALHAWIDADVKAAPLKAIQGRIWDEGYVAGELTTHLFPDVAPALHAWHDAGIRLAVYSSGSMRAQRSWFANAPGGDLNTLFSANFDLDSAGPKRDPESYARIARSLVIEPSRLCFLSDIEEEIEAARAAGLQAVGIRRPGETQATAHSEPVVASFADLAITPLRTAPPPIDGRPAAC